MYFFYSMKISSEQHKEKYGGKVEEEYMAGSLWHRFFSWKGWLFGKYILHGHSHYVVHGTIMNAHINLWHQYALEKVAQCKYCQGQPHNHAHGYFSYTVAKYTQ